MNSVAQQPNMMIPLIMFVVVFYFFLIRPQQKREKEKKTMITGLKKGDKVITNGGILAKIVDIKDNSVIAKISNEVKIEISKEAVTLVQEQKN